MTSPKSSYVLAPIVISGKNIVIFSKSLLMTGTTSPNTKDTVDCNSSPIRLRLRL
ncbi:hypothetical protein DPMN_189871 [Dreissena polymorpha]|uniref:Uncharacterized protein n=1 Tax=Dreissena polymorpha TaxID=45954 RepID=A0A9D4DWB1_DREPO|nr:hypothetical protein DPMN_189871 [Dreissena polymorpha]